MMNIYERTESYTTTKNPHGKIFALVAKDGPHTAVVFYDGETIRRLISEGSPLFRYADDGIKWKGLQVNKLGRDHFALVRFDGVKWNNWEVGENGYMSDAQESAVVDALNGKAGTWVKGRNDARIAFRTWVWTGHNHRRGVPDGYAENGPDLEVGGIKKRLYHS